MLDEIRARQVDMSQRVCYVDANGDLVAALPSTTSTTLRRRGDPPRRPRARAAQRPGPVGDLDVRESIAELSDDGRGVDVRFASGDRGRYDLVVGADGITRPPDG